MYKRLPFTSEDEKLFIIEEEKKNGLSVKYECYHTTDGNYLLLTDERSRVQKILRRKGK